MRYAVRPRSALIDDGDFGVAATADTLLDCADDWVRTGLLDANGRPRYRSTREPIRLGFKDR